MGPFPHDAPDAVICEANPAGTDGFAFVEFAHPEPGVLEDLFSKLGFAPVARHRRRAVELWRQGDIDVVLNADPTSAGGRFVAAHGPCAPSMAWRVVDPEQALAHAVARGATAYRAADRTLDAPAIEGIGGSLLYFLPRGRAAASPYARDFEWLGAVDPAPEGLGFHYLDHLTHNVRRGRMDHWFRFYSDIFGFRQIRFFDIEGKMTGLFSRALTSPCGKIRIPINESADAHSQIEEYLRDYGGEGIQHIALGARDIYRSVDALAANGVRFMPPPPDVYYARSTERVHGHREPIDALKRHGVLIDGEGVVDGGETRILLQIFSKTVIGPIFFEFIQRKGDDGFGEGNFKALFESIEADQIARGVIGDA